jgi:hypothetical protein
MLNWGEAFAAGLPYEEFLRTYGSEEHQRRWQAFHAQVELTAAQRELLAGFGRQMKVLCLAGAWCGDCVNQCPIWDHFARHSPNILLRFADRDAYPILADALKLCGGARVPVVVFLSEDDQFVALYGDRTLAKYRVLAQTQLGAACSTGLVPKTGLVPEESQLLRAVTQEWLDQFERVQLLLRVSPRLRQLHGD